MLVSSTILVTGASGHVGGEVVRALAAAGAQVRALTRNGASGPVPFPDGVQAVAGDLNDPASLTGALRGAEAVFLLPGYQDMPGLLAAAREAGAERVVQLSGSSAGSGDLSNAITRYMTDSETAVRESGLAWTILRPSAFMSNTFQWLPQLRAGDVVRVPFAGVPAAVIDPADIGAVAARALISDEHAGRHYRLTGPEALLPEDRLQVLASVLGRNLRLEPQPDDEARDEMSRTMPAAYVDAFFSFYVDGTLDESPVLPTVEQVTGRPPRTFRQWAEAHASAFR
jgi:uncharacterized protein YbjT (DUF2867 family)